MSKLSIELDDENLSIQGEANDEEVGFICAKLLSDLDEEELICTLSTIVRFIEITKIDYLKEKLIKQLIFEYKNEEEKGVMN